MYERTQYHWAPLECGGDPIPGSPSALESDAAVFRSNAENLGRAIQNLRALSHDDETCSEAVSAIMAKASATACTLEQVKERFHTVAASLSHYAPVLRQSQATSLVALGRATEGARRANSARAAAGDAARRSYNVDQGIRDQAVIDYNESLSAVSAATSEVSSAKALLAQAIADRNSAGETAAAMIHQSIDNSPLNDTVGDKWAALWETISKAAVATVQWIWDNIDVICLVLDAAALVLLLTGVGAGAAVALKTVSTIAHGLAVAKASFEVGIGVGYWAQTGDSRLFWNSSFNLATSLIAAKAVNGMLQPRMGATHYLVKVAAKKEAAAVLFNSSSSAAQINSAFRTYRMATSVPALVEGGLGLGFDAIDVGKEDLQASFFGVPDIKYDFANYRVEVCQ